MINKFLRDTFVIPKIWTVKKKKKIHPLVSGSGRRLSWQTDDFKRQATFSFTIPYQFLLLCRLLDTTPAELLTDFMDNLSCGSWKREGRDKAKQKLIEYFIEHGYGQKRYTTTDIISIFREMDAIGMLYPKMLHLKYSTNI